MAEGGRKFNIGWDMPAEVDLRMHPALQRISGLSKMQELMAGYLAGNKDRSTILEVCVDRVPGKPQTATEFYGDLKAFYEDLRKGVPTTTAWRAFRGQQEVHSQVHAIVMRYGEESYSVWESGQRRYQSFGVALGVEPRAIEEAELRPGEGVAVFRTKNPSGWTNLRERSGRSGFNGLFADYPQQDWGERLLAAFQVEPAPNEGNLEKYSKRFASYIPATPDYADLSPYRRPGFTVLLSWANKTESFSSGGKRIREVVVSAKRTTHQMFAE
jgi:hypothetical protein